MTDAGRSKEPGPTSAETLRRARHDARMEVGNSLHDGVVQSLTVLMMGLAVRSLDASPEVRKELAIIELELGKVIVELRDVITGLRQSPTAPTNDRDD